MKKNKIFLPILIVLTQYIVYGQYDHIAVFEDLENEELYDALVQNYKPGVVLTYGEARDTMFLNIDSVNDSLECVYTGLKRYLTPGEDPTVSAFLNGADNGINTEHSYPRSKGAEVGNGKSDMHHLYPSRVKTNNDRGSLIFSEINDQQTIRWYRNTTEMQNIPTNNIDSYSELGSDSFEPRESYKGNIARSLMYFYTMYRPEALNADPDFFNSQKETLCDWHYQDPVDQVEWDRTFKIAQYQEGKANPFVLDCSLASRLYCEEISLACITVDVVNLDETDIKIYPNPFDNYLIIEGANNIEQVILTNVTGNTQLKSVSNGRINTDSLQPGLYLLSIITPGGLHTQSIIKI